MFLMDDILLMIPESIQIHPNNIKAYFIVFECCSRTLHFSINWSLQQTNKQTNSCYSRYSWKICLLLFFHGGFKMLKNDMQKKIFPQWIWMLLTCWSEEYIRGQSEAVGSNESCLNISIQGWQKSLEPDKTSADSSSKFENENEVFGTQICSRIWYENPLQFGLWWHAKEHSWTDPLNSAFNKLSFVLCSTFMKQSI